MIKKYLIAAFVATAYIVVLSSSAMADDFRIYLSTYNSDVGGFVEPFNGRLAVTRQPMPFHVIIENTSSSSQKIGKKKMASLDSVVALEITNEEGRKTTIRKEKEELSSSIEVFIYFEPGETRSIEVVIDPHKWKGVPILEPGVVKHFKVRAILETAGGKIYSDYYDVTLGREQW
jgi:hypothetical protein